MADKCDNCTEQTVLCGFMVTCKHYYTPEKCTELNAFKPKNSNSLGGKVK